MLDCSKCKWSNPETCRICRMEHEEELAKKIYGVLEQIVTTMKPTVMDLIVGVGKLEFLEIEAKMWSQELN